MSILKDIDFQVQQSYSGVVYRMHNPEWAFAPLSGKGAEMFGGRFNPEGEPALYTSTDVITAFDEAGDAGMTPGLVSPMMLVSYDARLSKVVDLCKQRELFDQNWEVLGELYLAGHGEIPNSWLVFNRAKAAGAEALLVPSYARKNGTNLVFIEWNSSNLTLHDPDGRLAAVYGEQLDLEG